MARWSADGREVPEEVRVALAPGGALPPGAADAHVHVRSGIGSLLGDTHVVVSGGRVRVAGRQTSLDPYAEVELADRPRIDETGYRPVLVLPTREGERRVEVTALEEAAVEDLLADLPPVSLGRSGLVRGAIAAGEAGPPDLDAARAALVTALARRLRQRRAELLAARHARRTASLDHRAGTHRPARGGGDDRRRARPGGPARGSARREQVAPARPPTPMLARLAMVAIAGAVVFALFAFLGRAISAQP
jgi:hypothetical protein